MKVKVVNNSSNELPKYETSASAGMDLRADLSNINPKFMFSTIFIYYEDSTIKGVRILPGGRCLIPTGLHIALPEGYEAQIRPRSGLALKNGISMVNTPGTIDADYRGDVGVILINHGTEAFDVHSGDRIAQMVINKIEQIDFELVDSLDETERGEGGFGHTGK